MWRRSVLPLLVYTFYKLLSSTWKVDVIESDSLKAHIKEKKPVIFAHWHGDELAVVQLVSRYSIATMTSTSKDGQLMDSVIRRLGGQTSKGSSTRGGVSALKGLIRLVKKSHNASMAVDGPKGPIYKVKPGVFELSRLSGAPIVSTGMACSNGWTFKKSWNQAVLPKPFSRVVIVFHSTIGPMTKDQDIKSSKWAKQLEKELFSARQQAAKKIASYGA